MTPHERPGDEDEDVREPADAEATDAELREPDVEPEREELHPNFQAVAEEAAAASAAAYERYNAAAREPEPEPEPEPRTGSIPPPGTPEPKPIAAPTSSGRGGGLLDRIRRKLGR